MARRSSLKFRPHSSNFAVTVACAASLVLLLLAAPAKVQAQDAAAALGIGDTHGSLSFAPWEKIDTYTGNVLLSFTDLDLPGNAGFNLTVRRYCNSKNGFGCYLDYGFPSVAHSFFAGFTVTAGLPGSGTGVTMSVLNVPTGRDPNSIANGGSLSVTYQPTIVTGSTVVRSTSGGPSVAGVSFGNKTPVVYGASYSWDVTAALRSVRSFVGDAVGAVSNWFK